MRVARGVVGGFVIGLAALTLSSGASAAPPPDTVEPQEVPTGSVDFNDPPPFAEPEVQSGPLIPVPGGCPAPTPASAVFVATLVLRSDSAVRFQVEQVKAGSLAGVQIGQFVDVAYDDDARFLDEGEQYLVGVAPLPNGTGVYSTVRTAQPLFGGDAVIGANDSDVNCPRIEDPVRTLDLQGNSIDSGVFTSLSDAKGRLLKAVLRPLGVALLVLVILVALKQLLFAMVRSIRDPEAREIPVKRQRRHRTMH